MSEPPPLDKGDLVWLNHAGQDAVRGIVLLVSPNLRSLAIGVLDGFRTESGIWLSVVPLLWVDGGYVTLPGDRCEVVRRTGR